MELEKLAILTHSTLFEQISHLNLIESAENGKEYTIDLATEIKVSPNFYHPTFYRKKGFIDELMKKTFPLDHRRIIKYFRQGWGAILNFLKGLFPWLSVLIVDIGKVLWMMLSHHIFWIIIGTIAGILIIKYILYRIFIRR